jgi:hypothetical protein
MRFTVSLRRDAAANTSTPTAGSTKGMTLRAETNPASFGIHSSPTASPSSRVPIKSRLRQETRHPSSSSTTASSPHLRSRRSGSASYPSTASGKTPSATTARSGA